MKSRKEKCGGKREVKKKGDSIKTERSEEKKDAWRGDYESVTVMSFERQNERLIKRRE